MTTFHKVTNNATGILQSTIDNDDTSFSLASGEGSLFPVSGPFFISIEDEILDVLSRTSDTFTVSTRGAQGTVATSHPNGATVNLFYTAEQIEELQDAINSNETNIASCVVGGGASTDNAIPRFDSTTGKLLQNSGIIIDDSSNITGVASIATGTIISTGAFNNRAYGNNTQHIDYDNNSTGALFKIRANDATDVFTVSETGDTIVTGTLNLTGLASLASSLSVTGLLRIPQPTTKAIVSGSVVATSTNLLLDTEGAAATDDLVTITGCEDGTIVIVHPTSSARDITLKHGTGTDQIQLAGSVDFTLTGFGSSIVLFRKSGCWRELCRSGIA